MYEITLRGSAGPGTVTAFSDLDVEVRGGRTVLRGWLVDQAALHGILERARRLGLELLEVRRVEQPGREDDDEFGLRA
jgi:signal recognition particle subunit SEC65